MGQYDDTHSMKVWRARQAIALREWAEKESLLALEQMPLAKSKDDKPTP